MSERSGFMRPAVPRIRLLAGLLIVGAALASGCATTRTASQVGKLESVGENPRVLLVSPDIRFYVVTASGLSEPQAEWTTAAQRNFLNSVAEFGAQRKVEIVRMDEAIPMSEQELAYERLHAAVGQTVLANHFGTRLPTKGEAFDWSLGPGVSVFRERYDADYALFVFYRDHRASGGRVAMAIVFAAAGLAVPTGGQGGFASLVDLRTGDLVWFNLVAVGVGDLRDAEGADAVVSNLFKDLPER